jgi:hypothetical protein
MNRRELLRGLAAGSVVTALSGCRRDQDERKTSTLKVVLNGPFGVVFERDKPAQVTAFMPKDPKGLHQFYFNDLYKEMKTDTVYNFRLEDKGIRKNPAQRPYIDRCFNDFNKKTDVWKKEEYFLTVVLPVPDVITFTGPAERITFVQNHRQGVMPLNMVFEYRVHERGDVRMVSDKNSGAGPVPNSQLRDQYQKRCGTAKSPGCPDMMDYLSDDPDGNGKIFFFGVGVSPDNNPGNFDHAVDFFNKEVLRSFPGLQASLELESVDGPIADPGQSAPRGYTQSGMLVPAVWRESMSPRLLQASAVIDCKIGPLGAHVAITTPTS